MNPRFRGSSNHYLGSISAAYSNLFFVLFVRSLSLTEKAFEREISHFRKPGHAQASWWLRWVSSSSKRVKVETNNKLFFSSIHICGSLSFTSSFSIVRVWNRQCQAGGMRACWPNPTPCFVIHSPPPPLTTASGFAAASVYEIKINSYLCPLRQVFKKLDWNLFLIGSKKMDAKRTDASLNIDSANFSVTLEVNSLMSQAETNPLRLAGLSFSRQNMLIVTSRQVGSRGRSHSGLMIYLWLYFASNLTFFLLDVVW